MMKSKNTFLLLGVLVALVLVYLGISFFGGKSRSKSFKEELVNFDKDQVTKVEITSGGNTTVLSGGPDNWSVQLKDGSVKPANSANVNAMLSTLTTIEPTRIASRSEEKWPDFQVDDSGTNVKVYQGNSNVLDIVIGRFGVEGQRNFYSYVRLTDDQDTYIANNFMGMSVSKDPNGYRNNELLRLKKDSLTRISFEFPDSAFTMTKSENVWFVDGVPADSASVSSYLSGLSLVTSTDFAKSMESPLLKVTYEFSNQDNISLSLDASNNLSSDLNEHEVFNDSTVTDKVFKGKSYFLK